MYLSLNDFNGEFQPEGKSHNMFGTIMSKKFLFFNFDLGKGLKLNSPLPIWCAPEWSSVDKLYLHAVRNETQYYGRETQAHATGAT
jgi:hypothetical protein